MHVNGMYQYRSDFVKLISPLALVSFGIQLIAGLVNRMLGKDTLPLIRAHNLALTFYEREEKNERHKAVLNSTVDKALLTLKCFLYLSLILYYTPVATSFIVSLWKQEFIMAFNIYLPFTNFNTLFGYLLNMVMQMVGTLFLYTILMMRDMHAVFYPILLIAMVKVYELKLAAFAKRLNDFRNKKTNKIMPGTSRIQTEAEKLANERSRKDQLEKIESELKDLIKEYELYNQYIVSFLTVFETTAFVALTSNSFAIGLSFLEMRLVSTPIGLALVIVILFQVLLSCVIGSLISIQNQRLLVAVCDFPWYELSPKMKKIYLQFIHQCQNTTQFKLPIVGLANMELFSGILKGSYSFLNFLLNFM
jgi:hypothetical protein